MSATSDAATLLSRRPAIATTLWSRAGYLNLGMLIVVWLLLILAGISLIYSAVLRNVADRHVHRGYHSRHGIGVAVIKVNHKGIDYVFLALLLKGMTAYFAALVGIFPTFGTDELALDTYAAIQQ